MGKHICNYSVLRFMPYRETEEFANIGIVFCCPELGYFDFKFERNRHKRIYDFFPELNKLVLKEGLKAFCEDVARVQKPIGTEFKQFYLFPDDLLKQFQELTKHRESIFRFSAPRVILSEIPKETLECLFADLVQRQFAQNKEYQETIMVRKLNNSFVEWNLQRFYKKTHAGNEDYNVALPFTYSVGNQIVKAIKPLNLNKDSSSKIYEHGDDWIAKINRLRRMDTLPQKMLFTVSLPAKDQNRRKASDEICDALISLKTEVVPFASFDTIRKWAFIDS